MRNYIVKRLLLIPVTMFGILLINFGIVQLAPGGPVEYMLAQYKGMDTAATGNINAGMPNMNEQKYQGAKGVPDDLVKELEKPARDPRDEMPKPILRTDVLEMLKDYISFDFGKSYYKDKTVLQLIKERLPVSISLGLWSTLIIYLIAIPLGIKKAREDGEEFDVVSSFIIFIGSAIPVFLFAVLLIVLFAGGTYFQLFPLKGLTSDGWESFTLLHKIGDYFWHLALPITCIVIGGIASLTMLTKNSFMDELSKQYVLTARAKGLSENRILYRHVFRNAMMIIIAGLPGLLMKVLFTGSLLIEIIFSLNGMGLLGYEAIMTRDYPVVFGTLYIFALLGLILKLLSDLTYSLVDPRVNFDRI